MLSFVEHGNSIFPENRDQTHTSHSHAFPTFTKIAQSQHAIYHICMICKGAPKQSRLHSRAVNTHATDRPTSAQLTNIANDNDVVDGKLFELQIFPCPPRQLGGDIQRHSACHAGLVSSNNTKWFVNISLCVHIHPPQLKTNNNTSVRSLFKQYWRP